MNPTNQIDYPNHQATNNNDNFWDELTNKLLKKITQLRTIIDQHKQAWQYFLCGGAFILLGLILLLINKYLINFYINFILILIIQI